MVETYSTNFILFYSLWDWNWSIDIIRTIMLTDILKSFTHRISLIIHLTLEKILLTLLCSKCMNSIGIYKRMVLNRIQIFNILKNIMRKGRCNQLDGNLKHKSRTIEIKSMNSLIVKCLFDVSFKHTCVCCFAVDLRKNLYFFIPSVRTIGARQ